ncbi:VirB4 family type IV secretion/conjugal transfer ATPase [Aliirhizobium smilacinae]|uniref:VirB4 family type IV secretion/conjugal transfer ATPase n=1 Tax=Aliirhizobium smilacinae TaxID=1395944 RepID=A0A5C4XP95_9HYPH|nr:VirB4 family type IV secretion/conjugal transfer ATPase [Rhizobium smilacinae]TNM65305.1 VirB4 family type IV secretion/conjugal transfer ATPase [Rhizobium smilacinae]
MLGSVKRELGFGERINHERPMARHIPYLRHRSDRIIGLESGALVGVIKLNGLFFQTEDQAELNMRSAVQNTMIRSLGSSRYSVWSTLIRRQVDATLEGSFDNEFCAMLDAGYMARLREKRMFSNELYLTVVQSRPHTVLGAGETLKKALERLFGRAADQQHGQDVADLEEVIERILQDLSKYGARALGIAHRAVTEDPVAGTDKPAPLKPYSEPCEFFNSILTCGLPSRMRLPRMGIRNYIGTARLHFNRRSVMAQAATKAGDRYGAILSIKEYPPFSEPGMLDGLLKVNQEFVLTQSFTLADRPIAQERISRLQRQLGASDEAGSSVEDDIDFALDSLLNQEAVFGTHHFSLLCLARELEGLGKSVSELGACLTDKNITWLREDLNLEAAFWAQLPGNHSYVARKSMLSSGNFSGLSSMHNFAIGQSEGLHWKTPISILETNSQTPYWFNFHQRDVGHFLVTGPTGSGKTVALSFLLAQAMRVQPCPRAVFFDKDRAAEIFIRAVGGTYEVLTPGRPTGFNPLQIENDGPNRGFLLKLIKTMIGPGGRDDLSQEDEDCLERALLRLMVEPKHARTLSQFSSLLVGGSRSNANDLNARLRSWIDGDKAWLFNAAEDVLSFEGNRTFGFDMTHILSNEAMRTPALMYLYHRLDALLDGTPVMFFMDEGWRLLMDDTFSAFIVDKMKTIRRFNGIVGFGTQSAADIVRAKASRTLIEQAPTHIHFPNPRADEASYKESFGLTAKEFAFLKTTAPETRTFLIKHGTDSVIAKLDLSGMPGLIKVLSGRKANLEEFDALRAEFGDEPKNWLSRFCGSENLL